MLRWVSSSLCLRSAPLLSSPLCISSCGPAPPSAVCVENVRAVEALHSLSVDVSKVRQLKGWVLRRSPVFVAEAAALLVGLGASGPVVARVLELHPEAILCSPEEMEAERVLWMTVCGSHKDLLVLIEKFPASFFSASALHRDDQLANIHYFRTLHLNKRVIAKLMASAPGSFRRPVEQNREAVLGLQGAYVDLGGREDNLRVWLQKLLSQNPYVLLKPPAVLRQNLDFLRQQGFSSAQLLRLLSGLRGFVTELSPDAIALTLAYARRTLACPDAELREMVLKCPALLYYSVPVLTDRFNGLLGAGVSMRQIAETPTVLELTTQIVQYRIQRLRSHGYDVRTGSLEVLNGTKKDFEASCGRLQLRRERPLFNPVAPLQTQDE